MKEKRAEDILCELNMNINNLHVILYDILKLARDLEDNKMTEWLLKEINGYDSAEELPVYRYIDFSYISKSIFGINEDIRKELKKVPIKDNIIHFEKLLYSRYIIFSTEETQVLTRKVFGVALRNGQGFYLQKIHLQFMINNVKNKLRNWLIEIIKKGVDNDIMKDKSNYINISGNGNIINSSNVNQSITIGNSKNENEEINKFLKILETELSRINDNKEEIEELKLNIEMLKLALKSKDDKTNTLKYKILGTIGKCISFIPKAVEAYTALKTVLPIGGEE